MAFVAFSKADSLIYRRFRAKRRRHSLDLGLFPNQVEGGNPYAWLPEVVLFLNLRKSGR